MQLSATVGLERGVLFPSVLTGSNLVVTKQVNVEAVRIQLSLPVLQQVVPELGQVRQLLIRVSKLVLTASYKAPIVGLRADILITRELVEGLRVPGSCSKMLSHVSEESLPFNWLVAVRALDPLASHKQEELLLQPVHWFEYPRE